MLKLHPSVYGEPFFKRALKGYLAFKAIDKANTEWMERAYGKDPNRGGDSTEDQGHVPDPPQGGRGEDR